MQNAPIVEDQRLSGNQLLPVLAAAQQGRPFAGSVVPGVHALERRVDGGAVGAVPAHLLQMAGLRVVDQRRERLERLDAAVGVAARVAVHPHAAQRLVRVGVFDLQVVRCREAVHQLRCAAAPARVREQVEQLQPRWVREVRVVGVRADRERRVGRVAFG